MPQARSTARLLVTGGAGFIGSHVVEALLSRGDDVVVLDNFDPTYDPRLKRLNLAAAQADPCFHLVEGDIRSDEDLDEAFRQGPFDAVVHLAARAGVRPSIADPRSYDSVNVEGTTCVLHAAQRHGVPHVVLASSSSVYGATAVPPFSEAAAVDRPSSPYAATKKANELAGYVLHHLYGTSVSCLRFFTVYGPRQRPEMAIHRFTRLIEAGHPVPVFGDGASRRDYTYVDDVVRGVVASVDRPRGFRIYNLGTTATVELSELVHKIGTALDRRVTLLYLDPQQGDVPLTHADIALAADELDYAPRTRLDDGLKAFVGWFRDRHGDLRAVPDLPQQDRVLDLDLLPERVVVPWPR